MGHPEEGCCTNIQ